MYVGCVLGLVELSPLLGRDVSVAQHAVHQLGPNLAAMALMAMGAPSLGIATSLIHELLVARAHRVAKEQEHGARPANTQPACAHCKKTLLILTPFSLCSLHVRGFCYATVT